MPRGIRKWDNGRVDRDRTEIKCIRVIIMISHGFWDGWTKNENETEKKK